MPSSQQWLSQTEYVPYPEQNSWITLWICRCLQGFWECEWLSLVMSCSMLMFTSRHEKWVFIQWSLLQDQENWKEMLTLVLSWRYPTNKEVFDFDSCLICCSQVCRKILFVIFVRHVGCGWMVGMPALCLEGPLFNAWPKGQLCRCSLSSVAPCSGPQLRVSCVLAIRSLHMQQK
jgi:hypothetical protein